MHPRRGRSAGGSSAMEHPCPHPDDLQEFSLGRIAGEKWDAIALHIEDCASCQNRLAVLDNSPDKLVEQLQKLDAVATTAKPDGADWPQAIAALTSEARRGGAKVSADAGRDLARRLLEGPVRLDRFELRSELGVGSFGYVFQAWDVELERIVALKVQRAGSFASSEEVQRFLREARSAAQLKHPAIVSLYETGHTEDGVCYLVCEYIQGATLEAKLKAGPMPFEQAAALAAYLADALGYAHEHGVIHRDIKPSNIMLDMRGRPHLMDFGLAKEGEKNKEPKN